ncbi:hypothetical protein BG015_000098 [Linnemannia schmuckeri]|uniref:N-acetyltransferase domain-containing protein n=1 Tax=Linnemannia schmuckeri TaxID=64567 RepID=A0A9P5RRY3_9FUNG|nr:hypothetical protein BG015_000098 [Linnemannia schmuckeri]
MTEKKRAESLPLEFNLVSADQVPLTYAIETQEYPESEAASLKNLIFRQGAAPELFLGCYLRKDDNQDSPISINPNATNTSSSSLELIGYIVSTLVSGDHLTHSSMSSHDPSGDAVCIHSVCVSSAFQRRGIATRLLKEYLQHLQKLNNNANASSSAKKLTRVLLIAHEHTIGLYAGVGFVLVGKSSVEHGPDPWFEMVYALNH